MLYADGYGTHRVENGVRYRRRRFLPVGQYSPHYFSVLRRGLDHVPSFELVLEILVLPHWSLEIVVG